MNWHSARIPALGPRGEGWVAFQAILVAGVLVVGLIDSRWPSYLDVATLVVALVFAGVGLCLAASAAATLGKAASAFPKPAARSTLKESGAYLLVRHPIYGGILLLSLAWSLTHSPWALIPTGALAIALDLKSRIEEQWLIGRYPAYTSYLRRVRRRFVPYLW
jgi:protein-S-isoprenylcysteine O-methyltransferase Ste14